MVDNASNTPHSDQRTYFRINGEVYFSLSEIDEYHPAQQEEGLGLEKLLGLLDEFEHINSRIQLRLASVSHENRELAYVLNGINQKIDLLAGVTFSNTLPPKLPPAHTVNLSIGGLSYLSNIPLDINRQYQIRLYAPHHFLVLHTVVRIIYCSPEQEQEGEARYRVGCEFVGITDLQKNQLMRFISDQQ